jgi:hypothetical protein
MSKKPVSEREKDEDEDLEDEDEDEDEEEQAPAKPRAARARPRVSDHAADDHAHHDHDEDDDGVDPDDPTWWAPHAVMATLVLVGVLGFFGVFNKWLGRFAPPMPAGEHAAATTSHKSEPAKEAPKPTSPHGAPGMQQPPGETYGAKHLLVMYKGSMRAPANITRSEDEAKARATEAQKKARGGAKFEELVKEYSDEPGAAQRGGDLGTFRKGQMVPEFQNAVEKMKVNEVSDLVKTPFGYHVILRTK